MKKFICKLMCKLSFGSINLGWCDLKCCKKDKK